MPMKSDAYAVVHNNVVKDRGNLKAMRRLMKKNGGSKAGWSVALTDKPIGAKFRNLPSTGESK